MSIGCWLACRPSVLDVSRCVVQGRASADAAEVFACCVFCLFCNAYLYVQHTSRIGCETPPNGQQSFSEQPSRSSQCLVLEPEFHLWDENKGMLFCHKYDVSFAAAWTSNLPRYEIVSGGPDKTRCLILCRSSSFCLRPFCPRVRPRMSS